jgi:hypothetical protein
VVRAHHLLDPVIDVVEQGAKLVAADLAPLGTVIVLLDMPRTTPCLFRNVDSASSRSRMSADHSSTSWAVHSHGHASAHTTNPRRICRSLPTEPRSRPAASSIVA